MAGTYTCAMCGGEFDLDEPDDGEAGEDDLICDDCFEKAIPSRPNFRAIAVDPVNGAVLYAPLGTGDKVGTTEGHYEPT